MTDKSNGQERRAMATDDYDGKDEGGADEGKEDGDVDLDAKVENGTES